MKQYQRDFRFAALIPAIRFARTLGRSQLLEIKARCRARVFFSTRTAIVISAAENLIAWFEWPLLQRPFVSDGATGHRETPQILETR